METGRVNRPPVPPSARLRVCCCLLLTAICLLSFGCRMDMQDQPKYKYYRAGDMFLFLRFLPVISIFEMRTMVPEAQIKEEA